MPRGKGKSPVSPDERLSLLTTAAGSPYVATRRSRFSVAAKARLSLLGTFRKGGADQSLVSVEKAEVFFMNTRPHVWRRVVPEDDEDGEDDEEDRPHTLKKMDSFTHRAGELASFDEVEKNSPANHRQFTEPFCVLITGVCYYVPKCFFCSVCWHIPKWLCFECTKGATPLPVGAEAVPQEKEKNQDEKGGILLPVPFGVFEFGVGEAGVGMIERLKSRIFGNQNALDVFGTAVGVYGRELVYLSTFIAVCAVLEIPAMIHNAWMQPDDTPAILVTTAWGLGRNALNMFTHGTCDLIICTLLLAMVFLSLPEEHAAYTEVDKQLKTMHDFSIEVLDPPTQDPDYYEAYFHKYGGEVRIVTVSPNNGELLKLQAMRRFLQRRKQSLRRTEGGAQRIVREGSNWFSNWVIHIITEYVPYLVPSADKNREQLEQCNLSIRHYIQRQKAPMPPATVFVTFNTEETADKCLKMHNRVSLFDWFCKGGTDTKTFRSHEEVEDEIKRLKLSDDDSSSAPTHELRIRRAPEPMDIHWLYLGFSKLKLAKQLATTTGILALFMCLNCWVISFLRMNAPSIMSAFISIFNVSMPKLFKFLVEAFEKHESEGSFEVSFMAKLTVGRIVNFSVLLFLVTPYEERMGTAFIEQAQSLLLANCFWVPVIKTFMQLLIYRLKQLVKAATASSQEELNKAYEGVDWMLGERYTDMLKTLFMGLFFSPLVPGAMFITAVALVIQFWVDKASMLKVWKPVNMRDGRQVSFVSKFFLVAAVMAHIWMAQEVAANWPYKREDHRVYCLFSGCLLSDVDWLGNKQKDLLGVYALFAKYIGYTFLAMIAAYASYVAFCGAREKSEVDNELSGGSEHSRHSVNGRERSRSPSVPPQPVPVTIDDVAERDMHFPGYLPYAPLTYLIDPLVVADIDGLPEAFLPAHADLKGSAIDVKEQSEGDAIEIMPELKGLIAQVKHYPTSMTEHSHREKDREREGRGSSLL